MASSRVYFRLQQLSDKRKDIFQEKDVFIVVPVGEYRVFDRLRADIKICNAKAKKPSFNRNTGESAENGENELLKKDEGYRQDVPEEIMNNWNYYKSLIGKPVRYNTSIQLVHEETQEYVHVSRKVNLSASEDHSSTLIKSEFMRAYSLKLDPCSGPETQFMLTPCFKYQENDEVLLQDSFYLTYKDTQLLNKKFHLRFQPNEQTEGKTVLNFYLTEEDKSPIMFEFYKNQQLKGHLFEKLHGKALWITHIQEPMYLSLNRIKKATDQDENIFSEVIEPVDEALSQALYLSFKKYDPGKTIDSGGLWIGYASKSPNEIVFKHIQ